MDSLLANFSAARVRRAPLRAGAFGPTDALRLLDGAGDGPEFTGLTIDDFAGRWLVSTKNLPPPDWLRQVAPAPRAIYWKRLEVKDKEPPQFWAGERVAAPFEIVENGLRFQVDFAAGYSQGIFLDQRDNRAALRRWCAATEHREAPAAVLNLFAYTCAFSVAAAAAGAQTVSVDLSSVSLTRGRENFQLNQLDPTPASGHEFYAADAREFLRRAAKRGRRFDAIVLDPPTFSRDRDGKIFRVERDFGALVALAFPLLRAGGIMLCSTNQRTLSPLTFDRLLASGLPADGGSGLRRRSAPMPADFAGEPYLQSVWIERGRTSDADNYALFAAR